MDSEHWFWSIIRASVAFIIALWVSVPAAVQLLLILFLFDVLSCFFTHRSGLWQTLQRISVTLILCGAVHVVYTMAHLVSGFNVGFDLGAAVVLFYVVGELVQITLNCSTVIPIPPKFIDFLETAQKMTGQTQERKTVKEEETLP